MRSLIDFADERGIKVDTISQYLRRNNKKLGFEGHWEKDKLNHIMIDAWLEEVLAEKYHAMPIMGHQEEDLKKIAELEAKNAFLMEKLLMVQEKMQVQSEELRATEQAKLLIESKASEAELCLDLLRESLQEEKKKREVAECEVASFKKSIFGLYKKDKQQ